MMLCLFLGSGFSRWAFDLPVVSELFDLDIRLRNKREESWVRRVDELKAAWDKNNPGENNEKFIAYAYTLGKRDLEIVLWYIVRRLSDPFLVNDPWSPRLRAPMIDEKMIRENSYISAIRNFLQKFLPSASGIITTNYDLVVEYALGTRGFNYGIKDQPLRGRNVYSVASWNRTSVALRGSVALAKIHGSINRDETGYYSEGRRGLSGKALIVAPIEGKSPLKLESEWNLARDILTKSTRIMVFGFAFNQYDKQVLNLLSESGKNIVSVLLVNCSSKLDLATRLWPNAKIVTALPPPQGDSTIESWLKSG